MRIYVRTTVIIDDDLMRQAKQRAADSGLSLSQVVNRALREVFSQKGPVEPLPPFRMVTYGRAAPRVDHRPGELSGALEEEDEESLRGS